MEYEKRYSISFFSYNRDIKNLLTTTFLQGINVSTRKEIPTMKFDDTLLLCVKTDLACNRIPMLLGEPGIGKSSWAEGLARLLCTNIFVLPCNQLADKTDLTGARLVPDENGSYHQVFYPHEVISRAIQYAIDNPRETPILFLDEINRTTPDVTSAALSIPTMRKIGSIELPKNLRVICAGNDKGNVTSLDEASISRFVLYHTAPDVATFFAVNPELNQHIKAVLEEKPELIFCKSIVNVEGVDDDGNDTYIDDIFEDDDGMDQITTPRTISGLSEWLNLFTDDQLLTLLSESEMVDGEVTPILQSTIIGHVGDTMFARLLLEKISTYLTSNMGSSSSSVMAAVAVKPDCFDELRNSSTMTELNDRLANISPKEMSSCLVYALYEKRDNDRMVSALAKSVESLETDDFRTLMQLSAHDDLDSSNVSALLNTKTPLADQLRQILDF